jgi:hypothetical protein
MQAKKKHRTKLLLRHDSGSFAGSFSHIALSRKIKSGPIAAAFSVPRKIPFTPNRTWARSDCRPAAPGVPARLPVFSRMMAWFPQARAAFA